MSLNVNVHGQPPIEIVRYYEQMASYYPTAETTEMGIKGWITNNVKRNWIVFDAGANIGYYTILFSRMATRGKVYAFEPVPTTFDMLVENLNHNKIKNAIPIKRAIGIKIGRVRESIWRMWDIMMETDVYDFTTIDEFCRKNRIKRLDCIKIDTDGFDFEIVQGAIDTLEKFNPWVILEIYAPTLAERGYTLQDMTDWINYMGYKPISIDSSNYILHRED